MVTSRSLHAAATLHPLLVVGVLAISTTARAQVVVLPNCNFQEVNLVPCMAAATGAGGGGNISDACCSSLNKALDAGHRCVCSLLLSNGVFASLVANLLTLPLVLPLPGSFLYAPFLAACQATQQQQQMNNAPPAAASTEVAAAGAVLPLPTQANAMPPEKKSASGEKSDDGRTAMSAGNGARAAAPRAGDTTVSRSSACRHLGKAGERTTYTMALVAVIAVLWFNRICDS